MSEAAADVKVNPAVKPKPRRTVDTTSVASSDFEEVRLEDIETASEEVDWTPSSEEEINSKRSSPKKKGVVGKNTTVPAPSHTMADDQAEASATSAAAVKKSPPASEISSAEPTVTTEGGAANALNAFGEPIYDPLKEFETTAAKFLGSANEAVNEAKATAEMQRVFGLSDTEELMDSFKCSLVQSFTCVHNSFTPTRQVAIPGDVYITDKHLCFKATEEDVSFSLLLKDVLKASKLTVKGSGSNRGGAASLKIELGESQWAQFQSFAKPGDVDSALALIEHMTSQSG